MHYRIAQPSDVSLLASLNRRLIQDEGHENSMSLDQLAQRMQDWLQNEYRGVLFEHSGETLGYSLFRPAEEGIYLRQFFIAPEYRRGGHGREAFNLMRQKLWPQGSRITVDVLIHNERALAFWHAIGFEEYATTLRFD